MFHRIRMSNKLVSSSAFASFRKNIKQASLEEAHESFHTFELDGKKTNRNQVLLSLKKLRLKSYNHVSRQDLPAVFQSLASNLTLDSTDPEICEIQIVGLDCAYRLGRGYFLPSEPRTKAFEKVALESNLVETTLELFIRPLGGNRPDELILASLWFLRLPELYLDRAVVRLMQKRALLDVFCQEIERIGEINREHQNGALEVLFHMITAFDDTSKSEDQPLVARLTHNVRDPTDAFRQLISIMILSILLGPDEAKWNENLVSYDSIKKLLSELHRILQNRPSSFQLLHVLRAFRSLVCLQKSRLFLAPLLIPKLHASLKMGVETQSPLACKYAIGTMAAFAFDASSKDARAK